MLFLVIPDHKYGERVPLQIGTQVIDHSVPTMTEKEMQQAGDIWKQVYIRTVISKRNTVKGLSVPKYDLQGVKGKICTKGSHNSTVCDHCSKGHGDPWPDVMGY